MTKNEMKISIIIVAMLVLLELCGCSSGGGGSNHPVSQPEAPVVQPTPTPLPEAATPTPTPSPTPIVTYNCTNHPATGHTFSNPDYSIQFNDDCTYIFTDTQHITSGTWTPDPDPNNVNHIDQIVSFPMNFVPGGQYVCIPSTFHCVNSGWAGDVLVQVNEPNFGTQLEILQN